MSRASRFSAPHRASSLARPLAPARENLKRVRELHERGLIEEEEVLGARFALRERELELDSLQRSVEHFGSSTPGDPKN